MYDKHTAIYMCMQIWTLQKKYSHYTTKFQPVQESANRAILRFANDTIYNKTYLVMMDVEPSGGFYQKKSTLCQFPKGSKCHDQSEEGTYIYECH